MEKSTLIISLDFELFWGMQDGHCLDSYSENVLGGRKAIPQLLKLFEKYGIHATWATVGFMFAESKEELLAFCPDKKLLPSYENEKLSSYRCIRKIGNSEEESPCFYAPSLIKEISSHSEMEIGSHTFSHYYCREKGQTLQQFEADMIAAKRIAESKGYDLTSAVLPRNQCEPEYTEVLSRLGFTSYRDEENDWIHEKVSFRPLMRALRLLDVYLPLTGQGSFIPKREGKIWNLTGSRMYKPFFKPLGFLEKLKLLRIKLQMLHAAKKGKVFHLWWHPHNIGVKTEFHLRQLEEIFKYYQRMNEKYGMTSLNMREMVMQLEKSQDIH